MYIKLSFFNTLIMNEKVLLVSNTLSVGRDPNPQKKK